MDYADDVAIVAIGRGVIELKQMLSLAVTRIKGPPTIDWLDLRVGDSLVITKTRTHNDLVIDIDGMAWSTHLGVYLDPELKFNEHAMRVGEKARNVATRILPNISASRPNKSKLLANVTNFVLVNSTSLRRRILWAEQDMQK